MKVRVLTSEHCAVLEKALIHAEKQDLLNALIFNQI